MQPRVCAITRRTCWVMSRYIAGAVEQATGAGPSIVLYGCKSDHSSLPSRR